MDAVMSLTTDYGLDDGFVAVCHGVAAARVPDVRLIDVSHAIPPGDIRRGAVVMAQTLPYLPAGVHVGVVDPGVGTTRRPVAIEAGDSVLVGPDNGLLGWAAEALGGARRAIALTNAELHRHPTSHTFHGRDIFVPVAAAFLSGVALDDAGDPVKLSTLERLPRPSVTTDDQGLAADVLAVDHFGNVQLAADGGLLGEYGENFQVGQFRATRGDMFAAAEPGELVVLADSAGKVALAVNGGSAAALLNLKPGDTVRLEVALAARQRIPVPLVLPQPQLRRVVGHHPLQLLANPRHRKEVTQPLLRQVRVRRLVGHQPRAQQLRMWMVVEHRLPQVRLEGERPPNLPRAGLSVGLRRDLVTGTDSGQILPGGERRVATVHPPHPVHVNGDRGLTVTAPGQGHQRQHRGDGQQSARDTHDHTDGERAVSGLEVPRNQYVAGEPRQGSTQDRHQYELKPMFAGAMPGPHRVGSRCPERHLGVFAHGRHFSGGTRGPCTRKVLRHCRRPSHRRASCSRTAFANSSIITGATSPKRKRIRGMCGCAASSSTPQSSARWRCRARVIWCK